MTSLYLPAVSFASLLLIAATLPTDPSPDPMNAMGQEQQQEAELPVESDTDPVVQTLQDIGYVSVEEVSPAEVQQESTLEGSGPPASGFFYADDKADEVPKGNIPTLEDGYRAEDPSESAFDDRFAGAPVQSSEPVYGDGWPVGRIDTVFPAGLERSQIVDVGRFSFGVRASRTDWEGQRDSRTNLSSQDIFDLGYTIAGTDLTEERLEIDALYGLSERWTLFATIPFVERELSYNQLGGGNSTTTNSGLGDVIVGGRYTGHSSETQLVQYSLGLEFPTGDHDERGNYAGETNTTLPFGLQLGSGSYRLRPAMSYVRAFDSWVLGARGEGQIHLDRNSDNYAVGDSFQLNVWAAAGLTDHISANLGLQAEWRGDFNGDSPGLDFERSPLEDESRQGGSLLEGIIGVGVDLSSSYASANRLDIEVGIPIDEWLSGPNFSRETSFLVSWKYGI